MGREARGTTGEDAPHVVDGDRQHTVDKSARSRLGRWWRTVLPVVVVALVIAYIATLTYLLSGKVADRPRVWQYKSPPLIPAESYETTNPVPVSTEAPEQVELPPPTVGKRAESPESAVEEGDE
jgi:hypothetical protein